QAIFGAEDLARVLALGVLQPGAQAGQVLAVEELDGLGRADDRRRRTLLPGALVVAGKGRGHQAERQRGNEGQANHGRGPRAYSSSGMSTHSFRANGARPPEANAPAGEAAGRNGNSRARAAASSGAPYS